MSRGVGRRFRKGRKREEQRINRTESSPLVQMQRQPVAGTGLARVHINPRMCGRPVHTCVCMFSLQITKHRLASFPQRTRSDNGSDLPARTCAFLKGCPNLNTRRHGRPSKLTTTECQLDIPALLEKKDRSQCQRLRCRDVHSDE